MSTAADDSSLCRERSRGFYGHLKVRIQNLQYNSMGTEIGTRQIDPKNVARLRKIYELEGCMRLEPEHFVPALIKKSTLLAALGQSNLSAAPRDFSEPPLLLLDSETRLSCLHGKHRLEAAKEFLDVADMWWVVDLYDEDLEDSVKALLKEEYSNSKNFGDGEIYRYLRVHQLNGNIKNANKWMARLSKSKRLDVEKLQKMAVKSQSMADFQRSLDDLLPFIGLWSALQIGTFHRLLTLKCPEEMTSYLRLTFKTWNQVVDFDMNIASQLDSSTVELMQGKILAYSTEDFKALDRDFKRFSLFPTIRNPEDRLRVWRGICSIRHRIPSIFTFLEDTKYLEPCAKILKALLPPKFVADSNATIQTAFLQRHSGVIAPGLELAKEGFCSAEYTYSPESSAKIAYRQLWLFAMRHFPNLTGTQPRKDPGRPKPAIQGIDHYWWGGLAQLAANGGFKFPEVSQLLLGPGMNTDISMALEFLERVRPYDKYEHDDESLRIKAQTICQILGDIQPRTLRTPKIELTSNSSVSLGIAERCGRPFEQSHLKDKPFLFLNTIYGDYSQVTPCAVATSIAVKRDMFRAFFWDPFGDKGFSDNFDWVNYDTNTQMSDDVGEWYVEAFPIPDTTMIGYPQTDAIECNPEVLPVAASTALVPIAINDSTMDIGWLLDQVLYLPEDMDAGFALRLFYDFPQRKPFLICVRRKMLILTWHLQEQIELYEREGVCKTFTSAGIAKATPLVTLAEKASRSGNIVLIDQLEDTLLSTSAGDFLSSPLADLLIEL